MSKLDRIILEATIIDAINAAGLFRPWFRDLKTWASWITFLKVLFGLPLDRAELKLFRQCTGRDKPRAGGHLEAWLVCGRRAGKSLMLALVAVFLACFRDWSDYLVPGERGTIMVVASDRRQARTIHRYARALLTEVPALKALVLRDVAEVIDLTNNISLEILTCSFKTVRGYTLVAALCDEIAFWRSDTSVTPDVEVMAAIRPSMATVKGSMLLCASSPYSRRGVLWKTYSKHWGKGDSSTLVWQAASKVMNPSIPDEVIAQAYEDDPADAAAEYGGLFRTDVESYISIEVVDACTVPGRHEPPPLLTNNYVAFLDLSGGGSDAMVVCVGHLEDKVAVIDAAREVRPPCSPESVVIEFTELLQSYGIRRVEGDRYAGEWPRERFREHGVEYEPAAKPKSDIYREALPTFNGHRCELLDLPRLQTQLVGLERRTARGGRDSIDHAPGGHDDVANAVCGVLVKLLNAEDMLGTWAKLGADDEAVAAAPVVEPVPEPAILTASNHAGLALLTRVGEPTVRVILPERVGIALNDATGRMIMLPAQRAIELPRRLLDADGWLLRDGLRVVRAERVEVRDAAA